MQKANDLFAERKFFEASIEYERAIYNQPETEILRIARLKKALCYRQLSRYNDALDALNRINLFNVHDTLVTKVLYEKAFNLYLNQQPQEALWNIERMQAEKMPAGQYRTILPLKIIILNYNREWQEATQTFSEWILSLPLTDSKKQQWVDSMAILYEEENLPKNYSEETASNLSRFIPGTGQWYAGHFWEGAASFLINASVLGFGVHQIWYGYYFTGYVAGLGIFYRTYFGGMERAGNLAKIEKENEMIRFNKECSRLLAQILHNY